MAEGDYVRTDDGLIGKIVSEPYEYKDSIGHDIDFGDNNIYNEYEMYQDIIKSSPNIIDLIEVGDILVIKDFVDEACMIFTDIYLIQNEEQLLHIKNDLEKNKNKMLYSIATKEQFKNIEYEVK